MLAINFETAQDVFEYLFKYINKQPVHSNGTKKIYDVCLEIEKPHINTIGTDYRKWNNKYAIREWKWYLSQNRSVEEIKKFAPIWDKMHNGDNIVNSNYGYQWNRNNQLEKAVEQLKQNPETRQAWITIFDGKEKDEFKYDTPCTLSIGFVIEDNKLDMKVLMRSNDLWYGFCNDQFCFSNLQMQVALQLNIDVGKYFHYAADMHLYKEQFK